jgi:hypothetical protein
VKKSEMPDGEVFANGLTGQKSVKTEGWCRLFYSTGTRQVEGKRPHPGLVACQARHQLVARLPFRRIAIR